VWKVPQDIFGDCGTERVTSISCRVHHILDSIDGHCTGIDYIDYDSLARKARVKIHPIPATQFGRFYIHHLNAFIVAL